ncbi:zinc-binding alcohol dehydrogenase family protein [Leeuwenhoekiella sp. A16]|uniref:zinc-binding alcohol dehydrogenase family protein n=1 Tax=unclassified Leeuwenhoekiella TaxID=2615029 RepID=UPI003A7F8512
MKAVGIKKSLPIDQEESFIVFETEKPTPQKRDLLIKIKAVAVNPVDYKVRQGSAKDKVLEEPKILGWDAVGVVEATGPDVELFKEGDEVYYAGDITRPGCNAEYQLIDERLVGHKPKNLSDAEAAAMPLTALTAWECIFDRLDIKKDGGEGKSILIIGGAGGVGSVAIQLAKKLTKLEVVTTASRKETEEWCLDKGADAVVNHKDLINSVKEKGYKEFDYILNVVDTEAHWDATAELIKPQGKFCTIVETKEPLNMNKIKNKSVSFHWELMFTRSMFQTEDMIAQHKILEELAELLDNGTIKSTLNKTINGLTPDSFKEAHKLQESGKAIGKTVIVF